MIIIMIISWSLCPPGNEQEAIQECRLESQVIKPPAPEAISLIISNLWNNMLSSTEKRPS